jgi:hypothetical protein
MEHTMIKKTGIVLSSDGVIGPTGQIGPGGPVGPSGSPGGNGRNCRGRSRETEDESVLQIEHEYDDLVMKADAESTAVAGVEMAGLEAQITDLDVIAMRDRDAAKQKLRRAEDEYNADLYRIRVDFQAAVATIGTKSVEIGARHETDRDRTLSNPLRLFREDKLVDQAEIKKSEAFARAEMARAGSQIIDLDVIAERNRDAANQKFKLAQDEYNAELNRIRVDFQAAVVPISHKAVEIRARQKADLAKTLSSLRELREKKLADLAEVRKSPAPEKKSAEEGGGHEVRGR